MVIALAQTVIPGADPVPISGQAILAVVICIGLLVGLSWLLRRGSVLRRTRHAVNVESAVPLGERRSLVIVAVEGRRLLLGLTPGQISLVTELQPPFGAVLDSSVEQGGPS
jgi:flagellar protein FliO/FliZ